MENHREHLIVFTRYPRPGATKTRLIPELGPQGAADLQRAMTERLVEVLRHPAVRRRIDGEIRYEGGDAEQMRRWLGNDFRYREQDGGDLAQRMQRALRDAFQDGADRAAIIGCDIPGITAALLQTVFDHLQHADLAVGPARDGGYYLLGMRRNARQTALPTIFRDVPWGTGRVLAKTLQHCCRLGLDFVLLDELADVDRPEDLPVWRRIWPRISVVIPTLNEEDHIAACIESVQAGKNVEAIVVDGGSGDATVEAVRESGARLLRSPVPRARQMNTGAAAAAGEILLFLHADCRLPPDFDDQVRTVVQRPAVVAGAFRLEIDSRRAVMRLMEQGIHLRSRFLQEPYGDQGLFMTARTFRRMGGFPEIPIMEDFKLVRRLKRTGRIQLADGSVRTSDRRWQDVGVWRTWCINQLMVVGDSMGATPQALARLYQKPRRGSRK